MKPLLNVSEDRTFQELLRVADREALRVFPKVRLADVLPIEESGITVDLYRYALMAHFDFVVATIDYIPLFAVEFDGPSHKQPVQLERDRKKNALCERFDLPILRINKNYTSKRYNNRTLLAWIIEVYRLRIAFDEAQQGGNIPGDELFDPLAIISISAPSDAQREEFPYWISRRALIRMKSLVEAGKLYDPVASTVIWRDQYKVMRGLTFCRVTETHGLVFRSAMRDQQFPVRLSDLLDELLTIFLMEKIDEYLAGNRGAQPLQPIYEEIQRIESEEKVLRSVGIGRPPFSHKR